MRGIKSNPACGVAEQGADGPARRSSSVSRTWWTGPPPSSFTAGCRGPLQDGQAAKAKPLTRSCLRFWTRAWGQRELADEQTGRWISPAWIAGLFQGGLDIPANHVQFQLTPQGTPELDVGRVVACHALGEGELLCFADRCLLLQETPLVVHRLVEQGPGPSAVPLRVGRPLPEAPISCPARMLWVLDGIRPCLTTSEPRLSVSQWPNSTGARRIGEATQSSISPASGSTSVANKKDGGNKQLAQFGQPKVDVRFFGAEHPRSKQGSRSGLAACSRGTKPEPSVIYRS